MNELHYEIILSTRHIRKDLLDAKWINEYIDDVKNQLHLEDLNCIIINSLERKISLTTVQNSNYLVFDNYLIELFDYINYLYDNRNLMENGIRKLFYKLLAEKCYLEEEYYTSYLMYDVYIKTNFLYNALCQKDECLFCQQAFLFFHELEHYLISKKKSTLIDNDYLEFLMKLSNKESAISETDYLNSNLREEVSCDAKAAELSFDLTIDKYHIEPITIAKYIMKAQLNFFFISTIDSQVKFRVKDKLDYNYKEFIARILFLRIYLSSIIEDEYGIDSIKVIESLNELDEFFFNMLSSSNILEKELFGEWIVSEVLDYSISEQEKNLLKKILDKIMS